MGTPLQHNVTSQRHAEFDQNVTPFLGPSVFAICQHIYAQMFSLCNQPPSIQHLSDSAFEIERRRSKVGVSMQMGLSCKRVLQRIAEHDEHGLASLTIFS